MEFYIGSLVYPQYPLRMPILKFVFHFSLIFVIMQTAAKSFKISTKLPLTQTAVFVDNSWIKIVQTYFNLFDKENIQKS